MPKIENEQILEALARFANIVQSRGEESIKEVLEGEEFSTEEIKATLEFCGFNSETIYGQDNG